jgi:hypothetical protein
VTTDAYGKFAFAVDRATTVSITVIDTRGNIFTSYYQNATVGGLLPSLSPSSGATITLPGLITHILGFISLFHSQFTIYVQAKIQAQISLFTS